MTETRVVLGEDGRVVRLEPAARNVAHRIIEECMVAANVSAAKFLERHRLPALFRIHEGPPPDKVEELRAFLEEFGLKLGGGDAPEPRHFAAVIERAASRPDAHLIQTVMLRSLSQAVYAPGNARAFRPRPPRLRPFHVPDPALSRPRRAPCDPPRPAARPSRDFRPAREPLAVLGDHCSMTERRADDATRDAIAWLKCEFMLDRLGEVFDATITGVAAFGVFVTLDEIFVEGLVHVSALGDDYFHFDPIRHRLNGERTHRSFRLADRMRAAVGEGGSRRAPGGLRAGGP